VKQDWYYGSAEAMLANIWLANPIKVALLKPTYVPDLDNHKLWPTISAQEITGAGYTAGGQLLASKAAPYDSAADRTDLQAADVVWSGATFDAAFAAIYDSSGAQALWALVDFESTKSVVAGNFTLDWSAIGILYLIKG
jgi:hypothetical protein